MKIPILLIAGICAICIPSVKADSIDYDHSRMLVDSIMQDLKDQKAKFPILSHLEEAKTFSSPKNANMVSDGFEVRHEVTEEETQPTPGGPLPASQYHQVVGPNGILLYVYLTPGVTKARYTKYYQLTKDPDGPQLLYFVETNPKDEDLYSTIQKCIEKELAAYSLMLNK